MNNLFSLLVVMLLTSIIVSCKSAKVVSKMESKYYTDSIYSKSLSEYRKHNVYLPQNFNKQIKHSIIYATDGSSISADDAIKKTLDSLIENKIIKPIILIESFSNQKVADSSGTFGDGRKLYLQYRNFEYVNDNQLRPKTNY